MKSHKKKYNIKSINILRFLENFIDLNEFAGIPKRKKANYLSDKFEMAFLDSLTLIDPFP